MPLEQTTRSRHLLSLCAVLATTSCRAPDAREHGHQHPTSDGGTFTRVAAPPTYHVLNGYHSRWRAQIEDGIELARAYWGSYGPVHVWIAGREDGGGPTSAAKDRFLAEYCWWRTSGTDRSHEECREHASERFFDVVERGESEAYLSWVEEFEHPEAELVFLNVHKWFFEDDPIPDPVLRGVHEYTHVFQKAFADTPTWMMEGGAVFAEGWIPWIAGRCDKDYVWSRMSGSMRQARRATSKGLSIADVEDIDTAPGFVRRFYRELAYDAGAWATVLLVHKSKSRSVAALRDEFFPLVNELGWEQALCRYLDIENKYWFYESFDAFMESSPASQRQTLAELLP